MRRLKQCAMTKVIERHFAGDLEKSKEQAMRKHLPECASCRKYYERHMMLADLDPKALLPEERLEKALGLKRKFRMPPFLLPATAMTVVAIVLIVLFVKPINFSLKSSGFAFRGETLTQTLSPHVWVFRMQKNNKPMPVENEIMREDELAFAYDNPTKKPYFLIVGIDELQHIYWFQPPWVDPNQNPVAPTAKTLPGKHTIPLATSHAYEGNALAVYGFFVDRSWSVKEAEAQILKNLEANRPVHLPKADKVVRYLQIKNRAE